MDHVKDWPVHDLTKPRNSESDALESMIVETVVQTHFEYISSSNEVGWIVRELRPRVDFLVRSLLWF
jgi:hypothetical protein